jgi:hypothetical protein
MLCPHCGNETPAADVNLDNKTTDLFYEQQLGGWLGITPEHVPGEVES